MCFVLAFLIQFTFGGITGVMFAAYPLDWQFTDSYFVVAHFHYVLFGGSIFGLFSGIFYWFPKYAGRLLDERLGKIQFWLMLIGFNMTFAPFHILGLQGMPRRIYTYPEDHGWDFWNFISTIGSFVIAVSILVFIYNLWVSRRHPQAGDDPWDARTLEWSIPSPPPEYNFAEIPVVTARDDFWHQKYTEDESGRPVLRTPTGTSPEEETEAAVKAVVDEAEADAEGSADGQQDRAGEESQAGGDDEHEHDEHDGEHDEHDEPHIHLPSPSYWPAFASVGLAVICYGMIYRVWAVAALGGLWVLGGLYAWALEPATAPEDPEPVPSKELEPALGSGTQPGGPPERQEA
jgi:cytochrome c oxidase subunit I